jgi:hypothetical protein
MLHRPLLYRETSVFGFYYGDEPRHVLRREAVRTLFRQVSTGMLDAATSPLTAEELGASAEPLRTKLLPLLARLRMLSADDAEVTRLAGLHIQEGVMPAAEATVARHAAHAMVRRAAVIVSPKHKHLANVWVERRLDAVDLRESYPLVRIRTPETVVVIYED